MKLEITFDQLIDIADHVGLDVDEFHTSYSGRFMYGDTCLGLVTAQGAGIIAALAFAFQEALGEESRRIIQAFAGSRIDSMGMESIYYWPDITVTGVPGEE